MDWISIAVLVGVPTAILAVRRTLNRVLDRRAERRLTHDGSGDGGRLADIRDPIGEALAISKAPNIAGTRPTKVGDHW